MSDYPDPIITIATGDPTLIPMALADILDSIATLKPGLDQNGRADIIDRIMRELTTDHMEVIKRIASLIHLHQAATGHQTFSEWLATDDARRISGGAEIASLVHDDPSWPLDSRTYAEFRDYINQNHPYAVKMFERVWEHYQGLVLAPYGEAGTIRTDIQYATRIAWNSGYDEIHPKTTDGVSRFVAEERAAEYNSDLLMQRRRRDVVPEPGSSASASVVKRTVVYGPWYVV